MNKLIFIACFVTLSQIAFADYVILKNTSSKPLTLTSMGETTFQMARYAATTFAALDEIQRLSVKPLDPGSSYTYLFKQEQYVIALPLDATDIGCGCCKKKDPGGIYACKVTGGNVEISFNKKGHPTITGGKQKNSASCEFYPMLQGTNIALEVKTGKITPFPYKE